MIAGLTDALVGLSDRDWKIAATRLEEIGLVRRERPTGAAFSLDCASAGAGVLCAATHSSPNRQRVGKRGCGVDLRSLAGASG